MLLAVSQDRNMPKRGVVLKNANGTIRDADNWDLNYNWPVGILRRDKTADHLLCFL